MKKKTINKIINEAIAFATWGTMILIGLSFLGLWWFPLINDSIAHYSWWMQLLIQIAPMLPIALLGAAIHDYIGKKFYRDEE